MNGPTTPGGADGEPGDEHAAEPGYSDAEKVLGAWAAYEHPLVAGIAAHALSQSESNPTRRRQLASLSRAALIWWGVGIVVALVGVVVVLSIAASHGIGGSDCRGGPDKLDPMNTSYRSPDGIHWTAVYPCVGGGSTAVPVPAAEVPGGGN